MSLTTDIPKIMVFRPTLEEMKDFSAYITYMESMGAHKAGVAKVIPPKEFVPRKDYSTIDLTIPAPIQQEVMGHKGVFTQFNIQKKPLEFAEYKKMALSNKFQTPDHFDYDDLERKYWRNLAYNSPIYGADVSGTIYDKDWDIWNINRLQTVLDVIEEEEGVKIEGVNTAYLYFGMWKTTFAWHTEDMDLYSINYIHFGAPKTWYAIPPIHAKRLERLAAGFYPQNFQICSNFLRHKMTVISPQILKKYSIPYNKITQECGEFMITFPYGYHSGFNHGFNCAESTNFASNRWINFGKRANCCTCARDSVKINIDPFVRIFQPERYEAWKRGEDYDYIEEVDGPMSDAQFLARMDRKPHKKDAALLKRKMSQVPNKPRRHPVHKRGDNPSSPKISTKRGRMSSMVFNSRPDAGGDRLVEVGVDNGGAEPNVVHKDVKEALQKKIKEKTKSKAASASKASKSELKASPVKTKPGSPAKAAAPTVAKLKLSLITNTVVESEPSGHKSSGLHDEEDRKTVTLRTKRGSEEVRVKEEIKIKKSKNERKEKEEKKSRAKKIKEELKEASDKSVEDKAAVEQENAADAAVVRSEHAYSYDLSSRQPGNASSSSTTVTLTPSNLKEKTSNTHSSRSKASSSSERTSSRGKSKKKKKKSKHGSERSKHRADKGKRMKDFTAQEYALMKTWARSMFGLWVTQPNSFEMEQAYNASLADQKPGCCVCMLFYNDKIDSHDWSTGDRAFSSSMSKVAGTQEDRRMVVLAPEYCFSANAENRHPSCSNSLLSPDGRSPILTCSQCMIAVHASCYGENNIPESGEEWKCTRCREGDLLAECCLCNLRGGALKLTSEDTWAHIVCAMAIPEVTFEDVEAREPINIDRISPARLKLKCFFCRTFIKHTPRNGSCIQCSVGKCALSFHVTCAHAAGVIMEASDWPFSVYATCLRHPFPNRDLPRERPLREIKYGERVIAKYKNNRYYKCVVVGERDQLFYHVLFDDGTFSDNLFAQDIESHNCIRDGDPKKGVAVKVRWTDNELYNGKFVRSYYVKLYDVEFENEAVVTVKREDVYAKEEPLPKRVQTRFSHASDMQHEDFLENKVVPEKYRHLPCRDDHESDDDDDSPVIKQEAGESSSIMAPSGAGDSGSRDPSVLGYSAATGVKSDSSLTEMKTELSSPFKVKEEPAVSLAAPSQVPMTGTEGLWNSPVKSAWGSALSVGVKSEHLSSPRVGYHRHSPSKSPHVSPGRSRVLLPRTETAAHIPQTITNSPRSTMHSLNGAAGSSAMSASETAALAALAAMSSQSPYLPSPSSSTLQSSFNQR